MYGATNLSIGISLILRDEFSNRMSQARSELDLTTAAGQRAERASIQSQRNMSAAGAIAGVAAVATMKQWVDVGANFDKQMTYTYSIMEDKGNKTLVNLKQRAIEVGQDTMFSTTQVAEAMTSMAQAGQGAEQVFNNINSTAVLAAASMTDINDAASLMNSVMIGFNIEATEKNSMRVADVITQSINQADIKLKDFQESIKYIIPTATSLNVSMEEVAAMISTVGNAGIKGSMAGTNVENMLRYLAKATGASGKSKQIDALAKMGMTPQDLLTATGHLKSMPELIQLIGTRLQKMEGTSGFNAMMDIFGVRGGRASNLLAKNMAGYDKFLGQVNNSGGTAQRVANDVMGTLWGGMERLESTWESFKISFTEAIMPLLIPALQGVTMVLQGIVNIMSKPIGKFITIAAAGFIVLRTGLLIYRTIMLSLLLVNRQLGPSIVGSTSAGVAGMNSLTAATQRATAAATSLRMAGGMGPGGIQGMRKNSAGQMIWAQSGPGGKAGQFVSGAAAKAYGKARVSNAIGKGMLPAMVGGMALSAIGSNYEEGSMANSGLNLAGSALSGASTGAMLGSVIPGVGTAVGALVGGIGATLWTLYDQVEAEKERAKAAEQEAKDMVGKSVKIEAGEWGKRAAAILEMRSRAYAFTGSYTHNEQGNKAFQEHYAPDYMGKNKQIPKVQNRIIINMDGTKTYEKLIDDANYNTNVQFNW